MRVELAGVRKCGATLPVRQGGGLVAKQALPEALCAGVVVIVYLVVTPRTRAIKFSFRQYKGASRAFDTPGEAKQWYDDFVQPLKAAEWNEHVARGIPRDADGDAVIALTAKGMGKFAKVPDEHYHTLSHKKSWSLCDKGKYARGTWKGRHTALHLIVWDLLHPGAIREKGMSVDHRDPHQTLNNLESNLRLATRSEQERNKVKRQGTTSKYKGVSFNEQSGKWIARMKVADRLHSVMCRTEDDAARAVNKMRLELLGSDAVLVKIDEELSLA